MAWSFDTPSGVASDSPTQAQIVDSQATAIYNSWRSHFIADALGDELNVLNVAVDDDLVLKLLLRMCTHPETLTTGKEQNGDSVLFDNLTTSATETKQQIAAQALLEALADLSTKLGADPAQWRWGSLHTLTLDGLLPLPDFSIPLSTDPNFPHGFPRHGDDGTVDIGYHGFSTTDFTYNEGPQQRLVIEMTPNGPIARNTLPGGEVFNPTSPHYADLMELWRKNQTFNVAFAETDVVATANRELAAHGDGRVRFSP
jgi:penicillin amidase